MVTGVQTCALPISILQQALQLVYLDHSNHLFHQTNYHIHYFEMRQAQNRILQDMASNINNCHLVGVFLQRFAQHDPGILRVCLPQFLAPDLNLLLRSDNVRDLPRRVKERHAGHPMHIP